MNRLKNLTSAIFGSKIKTAGVLVVIFLVGFWGYKTFLVKTETTNYQTQKVVRGNIASSLTVSGQIVSANFVKITTSTSGVVSKIYVKDGDQVYSGQKIAEVNLDPEGQQKNAKAWAAYLSAKSSLDSTQAKLNSLQSALFKANQKLINDGVARNLKSDDPTYIQENADWLQAEADYKNQQSVILSSKASLSSAWFDYQLSSPVIYTPQAGRLENMIVVEGLNIGGDSPQAVATIHSAGSPIATFNLSEVDITKVSVGQNATVTLDGVPGKTFSGQVQSVNKIGVVSAGVTNYPILVKLDLDSDQVLPNMAATANLILDSKSDVLFLPSSSIQTQNGKSLVRVLKQGQVREASVETGLSSETQTEIKSGLQEGEEIIIGASNINRTARTGTSPFNTFGTRGFGSGGR